MSVIIDTTKAEIEMAIKYARVGANNCMIGHTWEIEELVRCRDCKHYIHSARDTIGNCDRNAISGIRFIVDEEWFCADGEWREG